MHNFITLKIKSPVSRAIKLSEKVQQYWNKGHKTINYADIDGSIIQAFTGTHPKIVQEWLHKEEDIFQADKNHVLTNKEKKHRMMLKLENLFGVELSKKHYKRVK